MEKNKTNEPIEKIVINLIEDINFPVNNPTLQKKYLKEKYPDLKNVDIILKSFKKKWKKRMEIGDRERARMLEEETNEGGYFTSLWIAGGRDGFVNNLRRFKFKKEVLNTFDNNRFIIERRITGYIRDKMGIWDLRFIEHEDSISAILKDLISLPKNYQDWFYENIINS